MCSLCLCGAFFCVLAAPRLRILLGSDQLQALDWLRGKNVALLTNHTGTNSALKRTADLLHADPRFHLAALLSPEHGLMGIAQAGVQIKSEIDPATALPVYSLYGETREPAPEMLKGIDAIVFDIQDLGVRFYTYTATLQAAMRSAARNGIQMVVLDRPNPIRGDRVEGPMLDPAFRSFVGAYAAPVRYGMTSGELAGFLNSEEKIGCKLRVMTLKNWGRSEWFDQTKLSWVSPSPNIPTLDTAILYPGFCWIEGTNLSEGRGTTHPFEWVGAPWIDEFKLAGQLNAARIQGVYFRPVRFQPSLSKHKDEICHGVQMHILDRDKLDPFRAVLEVLIAIRKNHPDRFQFLERSFDRLAGSDKTRKMIETDATADEILHSWQPELQAFKARRARYLLY